MTTTIRQAVPADASLIEDLLLDAARWVDALGVVMWGEGELRRGEIEADVTAGMYRIAEVDGVAAGAIRFQFENSLDILHEACNVIMSLSGLSTFIVSKV
jgi:hypothetical protein